MKRLILTISMLLVMGMSANGLAAQELDDAEGLESAYGRNYSNGSDYSVSAPSSSSSASSSTTPAAMESEPAYTGIEVIGLTFDSDENAENFLEVMRADIQDSVDSGEGPEDTEFKDIDELDVDKDGFVVIGTVENTGVNATALFVDGNQVFLVDVVDPDKETATTLITDVSKFVADADVESDEVSLNEDGSSTGGVFDRMPTADDDLVGDLIPADYKLFPEE